MTDIVRRVSGKGQVTIPVEARRALGIRPKGKVVFEIGQGEVKVKAAPSPVDASFQVFGPLVMNRSLSVEEMVRIASEEAAEEAAREGS